MSQIGHISCLDCSFRDTLAHQTRRATEGLRELAPGVFSLLESVPALWHKTYPTNIRAASGKKLCTCGSVRKRHEEGRRSAWRKGKENLYSR